MTVPTNGPAAALSFIKSSYIDNKDLNLLDDVEVQDNDDIIKVFCMQ